MKNLQYAVHTEEKPGNTAPRNKATGKPIDGWIQMDCTIKFFLYLKSSYKES